ncbi:copper transporter integral membrane protein that functions in high affinity copper transport [Apiospora phragmitis]|uniref:Copper transport protein n=1 Tax=Apiospora phragmitis TaxID=2905665 RepID=A0ABR1UL87_9PEZI
MENMPMSMPGMNMPGPMSTAHGNLTTSLTSTSATQSTMTAMELSSVNGADTNTAMTMTMGECKISMLWNWNTVDACFLAESWKIKSDGAFAGLCIGVILLVILLEFLRRISKFYDNHIYRAHQLRAVGLAAERAGASSAAEEGHAGSGAPAGPSPDTGRASAPGTPSNGMLEHEGMIERPARSVPRQQSAGAAAQAQPLLARMASRPYASACTPSVKQQAIRALIHTLQFAVGYWIMLLAMYYNGYIIICIFIGAFIGAFLLRWERIGGPSLERPGESSSEPTGCHGG